MTKRCFGRVPRMVLSQLSQCMGSLRVVLQSLFLGVRFGELLFPRESLSLCERLHMRKF